MTQRGGFHLRKWMSNSELVLDSIPETDQASAAMMIIKPDQQDSQPVKTLGVAWMPEDDHFTFIYPEPGSVKFTPRGVLSQLCRLYDPRGQLCPFTIRSRVLFQSTCIRGLGWDDPLDDDQLQDWKKWFSELPSLSSVKARRCFRDSRSDQPLTLHTFCDASDMAYAAVVYARHQLPDGSAQVTLAMAKSKPAPMKKKSIPQLELQGAVLGARVSMEVATALVISPDDITYWTDSMNVLFWVRSTSRKFRTEIGNRIGQLQEVSSPKQWHHVPGKINPADVASRGTSAENLQQDEHWWNGPSFLSCPEEEWPMMKIFVPKVLPGQLKRATCYLSLTGTESQLHPDRFSSWTHLKRQTAWCRRFIRNASRGKFCSTAEEGDEDAIQNSSSSADATVNGVKVPMLSVYELQCAELYWIQRAQIESFGETLRKLERGKELSPNDSLQKLRPVLEKQCGMQIMKVGGRLGTSHHLPSSIRHPSILPGRHRVTSLIIQEEDENCGHAAGANHLLSNLSTRYWIVKGKTVVQSHRHGCVSCQRNHAKTLTPLMGPLPTFRTDGPLLAFSNVAVDFAGPFLVKQGRGRSQLKRYACIFTCLHTRACHVEMAYSLDTDSFLMAFTRFCKRRGTPKLVVSDNGSNFVAAERELREAIAQFDQEHITSKMVVQDVEWKFNPPRSPHFGGVVEVVVRSVKRILWHVLHKADLTDEELSTALVCAESLINNRPLTIVSNDVDDPMPLTPCHFLVGQLPGVTALEGLSERVDKVHPKRRWEYVQLLVREVWRRWIKELVPRLNVRSKWRKEQKKVKVDDVFIVLDESTPRATWPLGRVTATFPGSDGVVRSVDIRIAGKVYRRAVHRLIPLEVAPEEGTADVPTSAAVSIDEVCE